MPVLVKGKRLYEEKPPFSLDLCGAQGEESASESSEG